eukprot:COSAG02_NODE_883_length_16194_cov_11.902765_14_plen_172_part_00
MRFTFGMLDTVRVVVKMAPRRVLHQYGDGWYVSVDDGDNWQYLPSMERLSDFISGLNYGSYSKTLMWKIHWQVEDRMMGRVNDRNHRPLPPGVKFHSGCLHDEIVCAQKEMQSSALECICAEGMRATCSNNEVSMVPSMLAILVGWMGYQYVRSGGESDGEEEESSSTMYS